MANLVYRKKGTRVIIPYHAGIEKNEALVAMTVEEAQAQGLLSAKANTKRDTLEQKLDDLMVDNTQLRRDLAEALETIKTLNSRNPEAVASADVPEKLVLDAGDLPTEVASDPTEPVAFVLETPIEDTAEPAPLDLDEILGKAGVAAK